MDEVATSPPSWRRRRLRLTLVITGVVVILAAAGITGYLLWPHPQASQTPTARPAAPPAQSVLPFKDLAGPLGVAVDNAGNVYVTDRSPNNRVVKLAPGSSTPTVLPFTGLNQPYGVAVDSVGTLYVIADGHRVVKLAAGSSTPTELPFVATTEPQGGSAFQGVAVDAAGNVYVADTNYVGMPDGDLGRVLKLAAGASTQTALSITGSEGKNLQPIGVATDPAGALYIAESTHPGRVLKLAADSSTPIALPFTGLGIPVGVAVDSTGNVYVVDSTNSRVLKLATGSNTQTVLPFAGLHNPFGIAVDAAGNVYVADSDNGRVVKLAAG